MAKHLAAKEKQGFLFIIRAEASEKKQIVVLGRESAPGKLRLRHQASGG